MRNPTQDLSDDPVLPCIAVLGPTCSGKTAVALEIAQRVGGEIVSVDSMQVYRGMDIGTAKATPEERLLVPHHLIDILDIHEPYDAFRFVEHARRAMEEIHARGRVTILVGGTGMYAKSLVYGHTMPPADRQVLAGLTREYHQTGGKEKLQAELNAASPEAARLLTPNPRRLLRAVEALRLGASVPFGPVTARAAKRGFLQFVLLPPAGELRASIVGRTESMLAHGWLDEARQLAAMGLPRTPTARQALGYAEVLAFLGGSGGSLADLRQAVVQRTWQFARRQRTWFRHQHPGAFLLTLRPAVECSRVADAILSCWRSAGAC